MNSGCSTWCRSYPAWMAWNTGSSGHVARGGRGCGTSASHTSSPWWAGSAVSRRCSAVVPVRGRPVTKIGRSTRTSACSGCRRQAACDNSRAARAPRSSARVILLPTGVSAASRAYESSSTSSPSTYGSYAASLGASLAASLGASPKSVRPVILLAEACRSSTVPTLSRPAATMRCGPSSVVPFAAVHIEALPGDRPGQPGEHEHHGVGDLVGLGEPAQVDRGGGLVVHVLRRDAALPREVVEVQLQAVRPDVSGRDGVDPDSQRAELGRQVLREGEQRG